MEITLSRKLSGMKSVSLNLFGDETNFQLISVSGLDPVHAQLNMSTVVGKDGTSYVSSKLNNRNIVILLAIQGNAESNRLELYTKFPPKSQIKVEIKTETRDVYIEGYVEYINCNAFEKGIKAQISIICPEPWFLDSQLNLVYGEDNASGIDFSVTNAGDAPAPFELAFGAYASFDGFSVESGGESLTVAYSFTDPEEIIVNTKDKTVFLDHDDMIPFLEPDSVFPLIPVGSGTVSVALYLSTPIGQSQSFISWRNRYGGV